MNNETTNKASFSLPALTQSTELQKADEELQNIDNEIRSCVNEFTQQMRQLLEEATGRNNLADKKKILAKDLSISLQKSLQVWLQDIFEGKFGYGELAVACDHNGQKRLTRTISLPKDIPRLDDGIVKNESRILKPANLEENGGPGPSIEYFLMPFRLAEVNLDFTTDEEFDSLFNQLKKNTTFGDLLSLFPKNYHPKVVAGEIFPFGYSDYISGGQMLLPTGRLAIIFRDEDIQTESGEGYYKFEGIINDPNLSPDWGGEEGESWHGEYLEEATAEEMEFLKSKGVLIEE